MDRQEHIRHLKKEIELLTRQLRKRRDELLLIAGEIKAMEDRLDLKPCPDCHTYLQKSQVEGITIRYCQQCKKYKEV